jgi:hypothetical protein
VAQEDRLDDHLGTPVICHASMGSRFRQAASHCGGGAPPTTLATGGQQALRARVGLPAAVGTCRHVPADVRARAGGDVSLHPAATAGATVRSHLPGMDFWCAFVAWEYKARRWDLWLSLFFFFIFYVNYVRKSEIFVEISRTFSFLLEFN